MSDAQDETKIEEADVTEQETVAEEVNAEQPVVKKRSGFAFSCILY